MLLGCQMCEETLLRKFVQNPKFSWIVTMALKTSRGSSSFAPVSWDTVSVCQRVQTEHGYPPYIGFEPRHPIQLVPRSAKAFVWTRSSVTLSCWQRHTVIRKPSLSERRIKNYNFLNKVISRGVRKLASTFICALLYSRMPVKALNHTKVITLINETYLKLTFS